MARKRDVTNRREGRNRKAYCCRTPRKGWEEEDRVSSHRGKTKRLLESLKLDFFI